MEYSEITPSAARLRNADDSLTYWAANLCIHFFTLDFLRRVCNKHERQLLHHVAKKRIPHVGPDGSVIVEETKIRDEDEGRPASSLSKKVEIEVLLGEIFIFEKS